MTFNQDEFNRFAVQAGLVKFAELDNPFVLKSGARSHVYMDWRVVCSDAHALDQLTDYMAAFIQDRGIEVDTLYGIPEGANRIAQFAGMKLAKASPGYGPGSHVIPQGRKVAKDHGADSSKYFVGTPPRGRTLAVEDVTTSGGSLIEGMNGLVNLDGCELVGALALTNRNPAVVDRIQEKFGVQYHAMSTLIPLVKAGYDVLKPSREVIAAVNQQLGL